MIPSPELQSKMVIWRQKARDKTLTTEDLMEAVKVMRADRQGASIASAASKVKTAKKVVPDADDLLGEIEGL